MIWQKETPTHDGGWKLNPAGIPASQAGLLVGSDRAWTIRTDPSNSPTSSAGPSPRVSDYDFTAPSFPSTPASILSLDTDTDIKTLSILPNTTLKWRDELTKPLQTAAASEFPHLDSLPMKPSDAGMALDWDSKRDIMKQLYLTEHKTLREVMRVMKIEHNFHAS